MNKFFCNIGKQLSDKIRPPKKEKIKLPLMNSKTIFLEPTNHQEIEYIIRNMQNKNGGIDNINTKTLKTLLEHLVDPLVHIFNLCIDQAIWPDALKRAEVIPLYKSKEKCIATNYRPISLISNLAKMLEKIIYKRITNLIHKCCILPKN